MRALVQRVSHASVRVDGERVGAIERGLLVLLGVTHSDDEAVAAALARKTLDLRIFEDEAGRMNLDLATAGGAALCVSQFTLYGDARRGRRPSFTEAAEAGRAEALYERFCEAIEAAGARCERGRFGARMEVASVNDGPVTLLLDSADLARARRA